MSRRNVAALLGDEELEVLRDSDVRASGKIAKCVKIRPVCPVDLERDLWRGDAFEDAELQAAKRRLNEVKHKLDAVDLSKWGKHTSGRRLSNATPAMLRKRISAEMLTTAWCKMYEMIEDFDLLYPHGPQRREAKPLFSLHLCEAPGGFIAATNHWLRTNRRRKQWEWLAVSLNPYYEGNDLRAMVDDDRLITHTDRRWLFGIDNSGDIRVLRNMRAVWRRVMAETRGRGALLVTADGSIGCMHAPGEQEAITAQLHYCEMVTALGALSRGGNAVLKMFTAFEHSTMGILGVMRACFDRLYLCKPATSKAGNSETYAVGCGFLGISERALAALSARVGVDWPAGRALLPREVLPDDFVGAVRRAAIFMSRLQAAVIEANIATYGRGFDRARARRRHEFVEAWMKAFHVSSLHRGEFLSPKPTDGSKRDVGSMRKQGREIHRSTQMSRDAKERKRRREKDEDAAALANLQRDMKTPSLLLTNGPAQSRRLLMGAPSADAVGGGGGGAEVPPVKGAWRPGNSEARSSPLARKARWLSGFARSGRGLDDRQVAALQPDYICVGRFPDQLTLSKFCDTRTLQAWSRTRLRAADLLHAASDAQVTAARDIVEQAAHEQPGDEGADAAALRLSLSPHFWRAVFPNCTAWTPGLPLVSREVAALLGELSASLPQRSGEAPVVFDLLTASRAGCAHIVGRWVTVAAPEANAESALAFVCDKLPFIPLAFRRGGGEGKDGFDRAPALLDEAEGSAEVLRGTFVEVDVEAVVAAAAKSEAASQGSVPAAEARVAVVEEAGADEEGAARGPEAARPPAAEQDSSVPAPGKGAQVKVAPEAATAPAPKSGSAANTSHRAPIEEEGPLAAAAHVVTVDEDAACFQSAVALLEAARAHHVQPGPAAHAAFARGVRLANLVLVDGGAELGPESPSIAFARPEHFGRFRLLAAALVSVTILSEDGVAVVHADAGASRRIVADSDRVGVRGATEGARRAVEGDPVKAEGKEVENRLRAQHRTGLHAFPGHARLGRAAGARHARHSRLRRVALCRRPQ